MDVSQLTPLTAAEPDTLRREYPALPDAYFQYIGGVEWGLLPNGHVPYSGQVPSSDIYGDTLEDSQVFLTGDDTCGYCFGLISHLRLSAK